MAFVQPITIKEAIDSINKKEFLIPAIQREFVWETYQIERPCSNFAGECSVRR